MTSSELQATVSIAFALEALFEKEGCSSRLTDLPGKPLEDFVTAGINAGDAFRKTAEAFENNNLTHSFEYYPQALRDSNLHKSPKTVNFGLLEIMFLVVHGYLTKKDGQDIFEKLDELLDENGNDAVRALLEARQIAWGTSVDAGKKLFDPSPYQGHASVRAFYTALRDDYDSTNSNHQWGNHALEGHPILRAYYEPMPQNTNEMKLAVPGIHREALQTFPNIKIGILADMCAAAIFLRLAETDTNSTKYR